MTKPCLHNWRIMKMHTSSYISYFIPPYIDGFGCHIFPQHGFVGTDGCLLVECAARPYQIHEIHRTHAPLVGGLVDLPCLVLICPQKSTELRKMVAEIRRASDGKRPGDHMGYGFVWHVWKYGNPQLPVYKSIVHGLIITFRPRCVVCIWWLCHVVSLIFRHSHTSLLSMMFHDINIIAFNDNQNMDSWLQKHDSSDQMVQMGTPSGAIKRVSNIMLLSNCPAMLDYQRVVPFFSMPVNLHLYHWYLYI